MKLLVASVCPHGPVWLDPRTLLISWLHFLPPRPPPTCLFSQFPSCKFLTNMVDLTLPFKLGLTHHRPLTTLEIGCGWVNSSLQTSQTSWRGQSMAPRIDFCFLFVFLSCTCHKLDGILCSFPSFSDIINGAQEKCVLPPMDGYPHCEGKIKVSQERCPFTPSSSTSTDSPWRPLPSLLLPSDADGWSSPL